MEEQAVEQKTEAVKPELVRVTDASDTDIEEYLKNPVEVADPEDEPSEDTEAVAENAVEAETVTEETPPEEEAKPEAKAAPTTEELQNENEQLKARLVQQEGFIQRRSTEYGNAIKELSTIKANLEAGLEEKAATDPLGAQKDARNIERIEEKISELENAKSTMVNSHEAQKVVLSHIDLKEVPFEEMLSTLQSDGTNRDWLKSFESNPYTAKVTPSDFIIQLHRRVRAENLLGKVVRAYKKLAESSAKPTAKAPAKPTRTDTVFNNIEKAIKAGPNVSAASGNASSKDTLELDPTKMSDAEIEDYLKKHR